MSVSYPQSSRSLGAVFLSGFVASCKKSLYSWVRPQGVKIAVSNDPAGFEELERILRKFRIKRILLDATGGYERAVPRFLQDAGYKVIRVNPLRARKFADSMGVKAKTDAIDAEVLAHFAEVIPDQPTLQISPDRALLRELLQQRDRLAQQRDDDRRRLKQAQSRRSGLAPRSAALDLIGAR